jgi:hypothetical protein
MKTWLSKEMDSLWIGTGQNELCDSLRLTSPTSDKRLPKVSLKK